MKDKPSSASGSVDRGGMGVRDLVALVAVMGLASFARSVVEPILPLHLSSIGISAAMVGLMFSMAMAMQGLGEIFWGWLADRIGLVLPLSTGTLLAGLAVALFIVSGSGPLIFLAFCAWGFCRSAIYGPGRGIIGTRAPASKKATYLAATFAVTAASRSVGALPGGLVADNWGFDGVFMMSAAIAGLSTLMVALSLRKMQLGNRDLDVSPGVGPFSKVASGPFTILGVVTALHQVGFGALAAFLPLLAASLGASATQVGLLFTTRGLSVMLLSVPMGMLADRRPKEPLMILGLAISVLAMGVLACGGSLSWLYVGAIASSMGQSLYGPAALGLLSGMVPSNRQSTAMGVYGGVYENSGIILGSVLGGIAWTLWGPPATFWMSAVAAATGGILARLLLRSRRPMGTGLVEDRG